MKRKIFIMLCSLAVISNSALAVTLPDAMKESMAHDYGIPGVMNLVLSMIFVIALIYITGWVYTKLNLVNKRSIGQITKTQNDSSFRIIQSIPLGQQRQIHSIEMARKILLIGSTPSHINLLKEFDKNTFESIKTDDESNDIEPTKTKNNNISNIDELYKKYKN